jgi:hypothetical protein
MTTTNEEMTTTNEEMTTTNEEMTTVNSQSQHHWGEHNADHDDVEDDDVSEYPDYKNCTHDFPFMNLTKEEREKNSDAFKFGHPRLGAFAIMCNACHKYYTDLQVETI